MNAVSSNMWAGMGTIDEIERGTLNRFLVTPVTRSALVNANVIEQAVSTAFQSLMIILLGLLAGRPTPAACPASSCWWSPRSWWAWSSPHSPTRWACWWRQRETIIGLSIFLLLPLTFLSSAFMARDLMPGWIRTAAAVNPVSWALDAGRAALATTADWSTVASHGGWLLAPPRSPCGCPQCHSGRTRSRSSRPDDARGRTRCPRGPP
jgi:ABC-2 type transport system permease protein